MAQKDANYCRNCKYFEVLAEEKGRCTVGTYLLTLKGEEHTLSEFLIPQDFGCNKYEKKTNKKTR